MTRRRTRLARQRGATLLAVLWMTAALSLAAAHLAHLAINSARSAGHDVQAVQKAYFYEAGLAYGLGMLTRNGEPGRDIVRGQFDLQGHRIDVAISSEAGKVDLNTAAPALIDAALVAAGWQGAEAASRRDALLDWIDTDDVARAGGSEIAAYRARGLRYIPANTPFETITTLELVPGFGSADVARLRAFATVQTGRQQPLPEHIADGLSEILPSVSAATPLRAASGSVLSIDIALPQQRIRRIAYVRKGRGGFELIHVEES